MPRPRVALFALAFVAGCHRGPPTAVPSAVEHSMAGLAAQHIALLPTYAVHVVPGLQWSPGRPTDVERTMDADIISAFGDRGLKTQWLMPDELAQSYRRNSTYATNPFELAEEPLRGPLITDQRLPEPLATQLRTLVALHEDVRLVLAPVELRLEPVGADGHVGRGVLRLVLIDARRSSVQWSGEVASDTASAFGPVITASIGARFAAAVAPQ